jgi:2-amino-4-hydroxy-6-hydroxymethyldihydropteridine diphosphokinase
MPEVFVGLGSNIEAETNLRWALGELEQHFGSLRCSSVYRSPALGFDGPQFLNMVVGFATESSADEVESILSSLEHARGRDQADRSGSRTLDLDLLLLGERVDATRRLPRVDVLAYPFVLAPLAELAPALRHPVTGAIIGEAWAASPKDTIELERFGTLDAA